MRHLLTQLSVVALLAMTTISMSTAQISTVQDVAPTAKVLQSVAQRFASSSSKGELASSSSKVGLASFSSKTEPDFQKHVMPLLGKLGCNGRACHGSFQGRGGFQLSLFGYDFEADHAQLTERIDLADQLHTSYLLQKPLQEVDHEGGQRIKPRSWQHNLLKEWIRNEAPSIGDAPARLSQLKVSPSEIVFQSDSENIQLQATAIWSDGTSEDVTCLCRFQTNDDQIAKITEDGMVTAGAQGDTHVVVFYDNAVVPVPIIRPVSQQVGDRYPVVAAETQIDKLVVNKLRKLGIVPSDVCTDEEFLRRASLDVTGVLPTSAEITEFTADVRSNKRSLKIDELLERPGYVGWWTTRLCDYTGNSDDQLNNVTPVRSAASQQWYEWIHERVEQNVPYDDIVEGLVLATSREPDESYNQYCENLSKLYHKDSEESFADRSMMPHYWSRANFRTKEQRVIGFAYSFLGIRIQCAQCHKHPFDQWTQADFQGFQGFFSGVEGRTQNPAPESRSQYQKLLTSLEMPKELKGNQLRNELGKIVRNGGIIPFGEVYSKPPRKVVNKPGNKKKKKKKRNTGATSTTGTLLGEEPMDLTQFEDVREPLMAWLRSPENRLFAPAFVNRVWANYFHAGIVSPSDDMNLANPARNAELLAYLSEEFIAHDFDMKWLHREILNSATYQRSWIPNATNRLDERNFSRAVPRRLPAEVAWDMMSQAVSDDHTFASLVTSIEDRAVAIPGSGVRRSKKSPAQYALSVFGRSIRESNCDCDRSEEPSLLQTVFLRNDRQMLSMLGSSNGWLSEVADAHDLAFTPTSEDPKAVAQKARRKKLLGSSREQLRKKQKQLKELQKKKGADRQVKKLQMQIQSIKDRYKKQTGKPLPDNVDKEKRDTKEQLSDETIAELVQEAYLRTLSRKPNADELKIASTFITEADTPMEGLQSVMWAILNTKEFIVNH